VARVAIDPITRIEGHLRVEVEVVNGKVTDAWASGGLYRGMETVLVGRQPTDAFYIAQRICGVCPISHGHASTMGSEAALGIKIPNNARIIRNIIEGAETLHSHILWFYTLTALDYVDVVSALEQNRTQSGLRKHERCKYPGRAAAHNNRTCVQVISYLLRIESAAVSISETSAAV